MLAIHAAALLCWPQHEPNMFCTAAGIRSLINGVEAPDGCKYRYHSLLVASFELSPRVRRADFSAVLGRPLNPDNPTPRIIRIRRASSDDTLLN
jgi:hypothetical protein